MFTRLINPLLRQPDGDGVCYFLAEESTGRESQAFKPLAALEAVARLGNFFNFPSVPRLVARVALAFSRSHALVLVRGCWAIGRMVDWRCI